MGFLEQIYPGVSPIDKNGAYFWVVRVVLVMFSSGLACEAFRTSDLGLCYHSLQR